MEARRHNHADDIVLRKPSQWINARSSDGGEDVLTSSRTAQSGVTLFDDMGLKQTDAAGNKQLAIPLVGNHVTVTRTPDGNLHYQEVLHWNGDQMWELTYADPSIAAALKPYLPPAVRKDRAAVTRMALAIQERIWDRVFSPPHPLLPEVLASPEYADYAIARELRPLVSAALTAQCGSAVAAPASIPIAEMLAKKCLAIETGLKQDPKHAGLNGSDVDALFYRVNFPGKIIATNGEVDPDSNEVVWSLYTVATCPQDVILTATCQAPQPARPPQIP